MDKNMLKDILDQYIYTYGFPFLFNSSEYQIPSISFQSYVKETSPLYDTIEDYLKGFSWLFNRDSDIDSKMSQIVMIAMFYKKDNDFICKITNKLLPYIDGNEI